MAMNSGGSEEQPLGHSEALALWSVIRPWELRRRCGQASIAPGTLGYRLGQIVSWRGVWGWGWGAVQICPRSQFFLELGVMSGQRMLGAIVWPLASESLPILPEIANCFTWAFSLSRDWQFLGNLWKPHQGVPSLHFGYVDVPSVSSSICECSHLIGFIWLQD